MSWAGGRLESGLFQVAQWACRSFMGAVCVSASSFPCCCLGGEGTGGKSLLLGTLMPELSLLQGGLARSLSTLAACSSYILMTSCRESPAALYYLSLHQVPVRFLVLAWAEWGSVCLTLPLSQSLCLCLSLPPSLSLSASPLSPLPCILGPHSTPRGLGDWFGSE